MNPYTPPTEKPESPPAKPSFLRVITVMALGLFAGWAVVTVAIKILPILIPNINVTNVDSF